MTSGSALIHLATPGDVVRLGVVLVVLTLLAALVHHLGGLGRTTDTIAAAARAAGQLTVASWGSSSPPSSGRGG